MHPWGVVGSPELAYFYGYSIRDCGGPIEPFFQKSGFSDGKFDPLLNPKLSNFFGPSDVDEVYSGWNPLQTPYPVLEGQLQLG